MMKKMVSRSGVSCEVDAKLLCQLGSPNTLVAVTASQPPKEPRYQAQRSGALLPRFATRIAEPHPLQCKLSIKTENSDMKSDELQLTSFWVARMGLKSKWNVHRWARPWNLLSRLQSLTNVTHLHNSYLLHCEVLSLAACVFKSSYFALS